MTKLMTSQEIKKRIKVKEAWLSKTGLEILYTYDGTECFETITPAGTAQIMETHSMIWEYWQIGDGPLMLRWCHDYADDEDNTPLTQTASWEMFILHYELSQSEAIEIACDLEYKIQLRGMTRKYFMKNHAFIG